MKLHRYGKEHKDKKLLDCNTSHINMHSFHLFLDRVTVRSVRPTSELNSKRNDVKSDKHYRHNGSRDREYVARGMEVVYHAC